MVKSPRQFAQFTCVRSPMSTAAVDMRPQALDFDFGFYVERAPPPAAFGFDFLPPLPGLCSSSCSLPSACALGCILSLLRSWRGLAFCYPRFALGYHRLGFHVYRGLWF